jgi:ankyrin repeat protein
MTMRLLLAHGSDVSWRNSAGATPLHVACLHGHLDAVKYVISSLLLPRPQH